MTDALTKINLRQTPQNERSREDQVKNNAGGYVFAVDEFTRLNRFLTIGTTGGTYYVSEKELTKDAARDLIKLAQTQPVAMVDQIVAVSKAGRAPKQNPAIFALAMVAGVADDKGRKYALDHLQDVVRIGTHLFLFVKYVEQFRGWGRSLRRAVGAWYSDKDVDALAYQVEKFSQREGFSHRDVLRLAHPDASSEQHKALYDHICGRKVKSKNLPKLVKAVRKAHKASLADLPGVIKGSSLSWEMLPSESLSDVPVWTALIENGLPIGALIRQLPRLTRIGVFDVKSNLNRVLADLADREKIVKGRIHPMNVLVAIKTYAQGHSERGSSSWTPNQKIVDALDKAFYLSYGSVVPSGKSTLIALDVSGSMGFPVAGLPLTCIQAGVATSMIVAETEADYEIVGFTSSGGGRGYGWADSTKLTPLNISPRKRLDDNVREVSRLNFGGTDCALPAIWARKQKKDFDTIIVITDSETWAGDIQPQQALEQYRAAVGHDVKMVVVAMAGTYFTIADPKDASSLDVSGFDASTPQFISDFSAGRV